MTNSKKSITKRHFIEPFVMVPKSIFKLSLSAKAMMIYVYLISKPENWQFYATEILQNFKDGTDSMESGYKELEAIGLLKRERLTTESGKYMPSVWHIFSPDFLSPPGSTSTSGFSGRGNSRQGSHDTINKDSSKKDYKKKTYKKANQDIRRKFHKLCKLYGAKADVTIASDLFHKIDPDDVQFEQMLACVKAQNKNPIEYRFKKKLSRWLIQEVYKDYDNHLKTESGNKTKCQVCIYRKNDNCNDAKKEKLEYGIACTAFIKGQAQD